MRKSVAVTIGFFDGVHRGHRYLLKQLEELASAGGLLPMAVTFDCHPRKVIQKDFAPLLLTTQEEKLALLSEVFCGEVAVLPFTPELSELTAKEFMQYVLRDRLHAELLLMGYDHRFGHGGGTQAEYEAWGQETRIKVCFANALDGEKVSSSRIRNLISLGEMEKANSMLGYFYSLTGKVVGGKQIGRRMGFPTANLSVPQQKLLPANGVYAVSVTMPDGANRSGMLCIGHRPTIEDEGEISVETHIFDFDGNLYGESISVHFIGKLRDEKHFDSLDGLQRQLALDATAAQSLISHVV